MFQSKVEDFPAVQGELPFSPFEEVAPDIDYKGKLF